MPPPIAAGPDAAPPAAAAAGAGAEEMPVPPGPAPAATWLPGARVRVECEARMVEFEGCQLHGARGVVVRPLAADDLKEGEDPGLRYYAVKLDGHPDGDYVLDHRDLRAE